MSRISLKQILNERTIRPSFRKGDRVVMTETAIENYGEEYRDKHLTIEHVATSEDEHPGFDTGIGEALYDLKELEFSLYEYEIEGV